MLQLQKMKALLERVFFILKFTKFSKKIAKAMSRIYKMTVLNKNMSVFRIHKYVSWCIRKK